VKQGAIVRINDQFVQTPEDFARATDGLTAGDIVRLSRMQGDNSRCFRHASPSQHTRDDWPVIEISANDLRIQKLHEGQRRSTRKSRFDVTRGMS